MKIVWTAAAWADVGRIYALLAEHDLNAADQSFDQLLQAPSLLHDFPRRGSRLSSVVDLEIRELRVGRASSTRSSCRSAAAVSPDAARSHASWTVKSRAMSPGR